MSTVFLPDHTATQMIPCEGSNKFVFADGRELLLQQDNSWPDLEDMPYAERVEVMTPAGAPQVEDDNIDTSNKRFDYDNGSGIKCALRPAGGLGGGLTLSFIFAFAWRGRRRKGAH
ncbi:MAG TPA: hypothetical protein ENJ18_10815 [Nannocystis exedens]|nr:hypothetical protein [Nannocystis exedens]